MARELGSDQLTLGRQAIEDLVPDASDAFVRRYLVQADAASVLNHRAVELVGVNRFAGVAMDIPGQRIRVFLAGSDFEAVSRTLTGRLPDVVMTKVDVPLAELKVLGTAVADQIENLAGQGVTVVAVGPDIKRNEVLIGVATDVAQAQDIVTRSFPRDAGRLVGLPFGSNPITCPVRALRGWCDTAATTADGPLFRAVTRSEKLGRGRRPPGQSWSGGSAPPALVAFLDVVDVEGVLLVVAHDPRARELQPWDLDQ